ncbi:Asp-tRNA(Asn)/Glu-tRNA(Gln) amidotransferase subunit GatC [Patescibacteria group bacterium]|nr:Asp-tRNA(Asn)/Glu-tRNA(Gln) amidotransferase subunit GatC [Patescibacteria group bacterium]
MADKNISKDEIKDLGELARVSVGTDEAKKLQGDLEEILGFVSKLKEADVSQVDDEKSVAKNVYRKDELPHGGGEFTEKILDNAPSKKENFVKVKKVL